LKSSLSVLQMLVSSSPVSVVGTKGSCWAES
jgi:hypothetical protein